MGFYIRDAIRLGPFRLNLSKSGLGLSFGVTGLRIGIGPRGPYLHAGREGLYYRTSLRGMMPSSGGEAEPILTGFAEPSFAGTPSLAVPLPGVVETPLVAALNAGHRRRRQRWWLTLLAVLVASQLIAVAGSAGIAGLLLVPLAWVGGGRLDRWCRRVTHAYPAEVIADDRYRALDAAFAGLATGHVVGPVPVTLTRRLPDALSANLVPPAMLLRRCGLYLMPDGVLVATRQGYASLPYAELIAALEHDTLAVDGTPPAGAEIVGYRWAHANQDGGRDRRFATNHRLAECRLELLRIRNPAGLDLTLRFAMPGSMAPFVQALRRLGASAEAPPAPVVVMASDPGAARQSTWERMVRSAAATASKEIRDA